MLSLNIVKTLLTFITSWIFFIRSPLSFIVVKRSLFYSLYLLEKFSSILNSKSRFCLKARKAFLVFNFYCSVSFKINFWTFYSYKFKWLGFRVSMAAFLCLKYLSWIKFSRMKIAVNLLLVLTTGESFLTIGLSTNFFILHRATWLPILAVIQSLLTSSLSRSGLDLIIHLRKLLRVSYPQLRFLAYNRILALSRSEAFNIADFLDSLFLNILKKAFDLC